MSRVMDELESERRQERWKLAKRAHRERKKVRAVTLPPQFREALMQERNRRASIAARASRRMNGIYVDLAYYTGDFVADVHHQPHVIPRILFPIERDEFIDARPGFPRNESNGAGAERGVFLAIQYE